MKRVRDSNQRPISHPSDSAEEVLISDGESTQSRADRQRIRHNNNESQSENELTTGRIGDTPHNLALLSPRPSTTSIPAATSIPARPTVVNLSSLPVAITTLNADNTRGLRSTTTTMGSNHTDRNDDEIDNEDNKYDTLGYPVQDPMRDPMRGGGQINKRVDDEHDEHDEHDEYDSDFYGDYIEHTQTTALRSDNKKSIVRGGGSTSVISPVPVSSITPSSGIPRPVSLSSTRFGPSESPRRARLPDRPSLTSPISVSPLATSLSALAVSGGESKHRSVVHDTMPKTPVAISPLSVHSVSASTPSSRTPTSRSMSHGISSTSRMIGNETIRRTAGEIRSHGAISESNSAPSPSPGSRRSDHRSQSRESTRSESAKSAVSPRSQASWHAAQEAGERDKEMERRRFESGDSGTGTANDARLTPRVEENKGSHGGAIHLSKCITRDEITAKAHVIVDRKQFNSEQDLLMRQLEHMVLRGAVRSNFLIEGPVQSGKTTAAFGIFNYLDNVRHLDGSRFLPILIHAKIAQWRRDTFSGNILEQVLKLGTPVDKDLQKSNSIKTVICNILNYNDESKQGNHDDHKETIRLRNALMSGITHLIIDDAHYLSTDTWNLLDELFQTIRNNIHPFGGMSVIAFFTGSVCVNTRPLWLGPNWNRLLTFGGKAYSMNHFSTGFIPYHVMLTGGANEVSGAYHIHVVADRRMDKNFHLNQGLIMRMKFFACLNNWYSPDSGEIIQRELRDLFWNDETVVARDGSSVPTPTTKTISGITRRITRTQLKSASHQPFLIGGGERKKSTAVSEESIVSIVRPSWTDVRSSRMNIYWIEQLHLLSRALAEFPDERRLFPLGCPPVYICCSSKDTDMISMREHHILASRQSKDDERRIKGGIHQIGDSASTDILIRHIQFLFPHDIDGAYTNGTPIMFTCSSMASPVSDDSDAIPREYQHGDFGIFRRFNDEMMYAEVDLITWNDATKLWVSKPVKAYAFQHEISFLEDILSEDDPNIVKQKVNILTMPFIRAYALTYSESVNLRAPLIILQMEPPTLAPSQHGRVPAKMTSASRRMESKILYHPGVAAAICSSAHPCSTIFFVGSKASVIGNLTVSKIVNYKAYQTIPRMNLPISTLEPNDPGRDVRDIRGVRDEEVGGRDLRDVRDVRGVRDEEVRMDVREDI